MGFPGQVLKYLRPKRGILFVASLEETAEALEVRPNKTLKNPNTRTKGRPSGNERTRILKIRTRIRVTALFFDSAEV